MNDYSCYVCYTSDYYMWAPEKPTTSCTSGWSTALNGVTKDDCHKGNCYHCISTDKYVWNDSTPSISCPGGLGIGEWKIDYDKTIQNCK